MEKESRFFMNLRLFSGCHLDLNRFSSDFFLCSLSVVLLPLFSLSPLSLLHPPTVVTVFLSAVCSAWHSVWRMTVFPEGGMRVTPPPLLTPWPLLSPQPLHHCNEASTTQTRGKESSFCPLIDRAGMTMYIFIVFNT